jgi:hypothetical protein
MGFTKRLLALEEQRRDTAIGIAIRAGVLRSCEHHAEPYLADDFVSAKVEPAYRLGNAKFTRGDFKEVFESRRVMTDAIKDAVDDFALNYCSICDKILSD